MFMPVLIGVRGLGLMLLTKRLPAHLGTKPLNRPFWQLWNYRLQRLRTQPNEQTQLARATKQLQDENSICEIIDTYIYIYICVSIYRYMYIYIYIYMHTFIWFGALRNARTLDVQKLGTQLLPL